MRSYRPAIESKQASAFGSIRVGFSQCSVCNTAHLRQNDKYPSRTDTAHLSQIETNYPKKGITIDRLG
jgi:hypothetical protein